MLISFSVSNFRSIKDEQTLDFTAGSSDLKDDNIINIEDKKIRLLKSIVLYGGNASGKTNLIRAFFAFRNLVVNSTDLKKGDLIPDLYYDPFLLDKKTVSKPTIFKVDFIGYDRKRYNYETRFDRKQVVYENLVVYETSQPSNLFLRENAEERVKIYERFQDQKIDVTVLSNHLFLSKAGNSPNDQIGDIYLLFKNAHVWNAAESNNIKALFRNIRDQFIQPENELFRKRLTKLINLSDTKIDSVFIGPSEKIEIPNLEGFPETLSAEIKRKLAEELKYQVYGTHKTFEDNTAVGEVNFEFFKRESTGTQVMFAIGGLILSSLLSEKPGLILFDEFDNSLHPELCRFLIEMFHNPIVNRNNSQMAFATHETQLLDRGLFRKDQIWFAEKDSFGKSEFYSVSDFGGEGNLREGIPFDKWYKAGKFGGIPHIKKVEFFAEYESEEENS